MSSERVANAFLQQYLKDQVAGTSRSLEQYQALFPGHEGLVSERLAELEAGGTPAASDGRLVDRIGSYRILGEIGRGGQGVVYLAEDERLRRRVALKMLTGLGSLAPDRVARFLREAEVASRLDHPAIATVYETGTEEGVPYIAMKYVEGEPLTTRIAASKGTIVETMRIVELCARALDAAHKNGVIHRDIKPGNIVVTREGEPVILDFGLAHDADSDLVSITRTGDFSGTPAYMSPEQIAVQRTRPDARTDVWSLGVTLYECLTFRRPFEAPTREGLYLQILTKDPPEARTLNGSIPPDLEIVLQTAIEKDPDRRYKTALDFAEELRRVRLHEPIVARPVGRIVRLQRWAQRNPMLAAAVGGLFLVLASGLAVALFLLGQRDRALSEVTQERNAKNTALTQVTTERNEKQAALSDYDRLGDFSRLQRLQAEADRLWPCEPSKVAAMKSWVDQAADLERRVPGHREVLARLRSSSGVIPGAAQTWNFGSSTAEQFKHDTTAKLVEDLMAFADPDPKKGLLADVRARLAFAESVERDTIGNHEARWADAIRSIADVNECPKYRGLRIKPELGLIPIGRDAQSGLWEFIHLQTTAPGGDPIPKRRADGRLIVTESMGLVFVLVPGGTFSMGAVKPDEEQAPTEPNVDPAARMDEWPVKQVTLDPFFLSKYEMTQGQWLRLVGSNPSRYVPGLKTRGKIVVDFSNPVEQVTWEDCDLWLGRLGLVLPTEARWEYGARGGTTTPWWTGIDKDSLSKAANLADRFFKENGGFVGFTYESWDDGYGCHAPVGALDPNPFGLHDVIGNVWEWCRDAYCGYAEEPGAGDGLRTSSLPKSAPNYMLVGRGGSFCDDASIARCTNRFTFTPVFRSYNLGVRPARECRRD
jgi:formylglycine-generating enzyme required for sulfatase activity/predicted Ser/Thr protein kinase